VTSKAEGDGVKARPRRIWLTLQPEEVVELKQLMVDRDVEGTSAFFQHIVVPRVGNTAKRRNIDIKLSSEEVEAS